MHESKLREPNTDMPYPSFMHELVAKHPEIRQDIKIYPYKDGSGWLIKSKEPGSQIPNVTFNTIREACLEKGCKIVKTKDGDLDITKSSPLPVEDSGELWKLTVSGEKEPENILGVIHDLEDIIGHPVAKEANDHAWTFIWEFPNKETAMDAKHLVGLKHPDYILDVIQDMDEVHETISPDDMWNKIDGTNESVTDEALNVSGGWGVHDGNVAKHRNNIQVIRDAMIENIDASIQNQYPNVTIRVRDTVKAPPEPMEHDGNEIMDIDVRWVLSKVENGYHVKFGDKSVCAIGDDAELKDAMAALETAYTNEGWRVQTREKGITLQASRRKSS